MKLTRVELDNIRKANGFHSDNEAYKWILETFPESVFYDNLEIMELRSDVQSMLDLKIKRND